MGNSLCGTGRQLVSSPDSRPMTQCASAANGSLMRPLKSSLAVGMGQSNCGTDPSTYVFHTTLHANCNYTSLLCNTSISTKCVSLSKVFRV